MKFEKQLSLRSKKEATWPNSGQKYWKVRVSDVIDYETVEMNLGEETDGEQLVPGEMYTAVIQLEKNGYNHVARNIDLYPLKSPSTDKKS